MLEIKDLTYTIGNKVILLDLSLFVPPQSIYALLGANGAGKTTLFQLILGLKQPNRGSITLNGISLTAQNRATFMRQLGILFDRAPLYDHLSALENLEQSRRIYNTPPATSWEMLEMVGLTPVAKEKVSTFSMGMKQRLGIALAMVGKPSFLLLDEPTNGLDPQGIAELRHIIRQLHQTQQITCLLSSHAIAEVEKIATHTGILHQGAIVHEATLDAQPTQTLEEIYFEKTKQKLL